MPVLLAEVIADAATAYAGVGLVVGVAFLLLGIDKLDAGARGAYAFRPLVLPGLALAWPYVLWRWAGGAAPGCAGQRRHRATHRWTWLALAILLPGLFVTALTLRAPAGEAPVRITAP